MASFTPNEYNEDIDVYNGIWRGIVVDNKDPEVKGRLKIYVHGVYPKTLARAPENLPWAEPMMPLFGGNWTNERDGCLNKEVGCSTIPHTTLEKNKPWTGAYVWVFFEHGHSSNPIYMGACQGGEGWFSEHSNQHVFKTDNVRIRIDEAYTGLSGEPSPIKKETTTCYFDSYNSKCNSQSKNNHQIKKMPTRVDIEIWAEENPEQYKSQKCALNLNIRGNVNMTVNGNVFEEINGNKHETLSGNLYREQVGDVYHHLKGDYIFEQEGKYQQKIVGDKLLELIGNESYTISKNRDLTVGGKYHKLIKSEYDLDVFGHFSEELKTTKTIETGSDYSTIVGGNYTNITMKNVNISAGENSIYTSEKDCKSEVGGDKNDIVVGLVRNEYRSDKEEFIGGMSHVNVTNKLAEYVGKTKHEYVKEEYYSTIDGDEFKVNMKKFSHLVNDNFLEMVYGDKNELLYKKYDLAVYEDYKRIFFSSLITQITKNDEKTILGDYKLITTNSILIESSTTATVKGESSLVLTSSGNTKIVGSQIELN